MSLPVAALLALLVAAKLFFQLKNFCKTHRCHPKPTNQPTTTNSTHPMNFHSGYLSQVDGSVHFHINDTAVICSVSAPIEAKPRQELPTTIAVELIVRPATGVPTTREVNIQDILNNIAKQIIVGELYPRQLCQITCQVLEAGEPSKFNNIEVISCVNAMSAALVNSGIAMNSLALGVVVAVVGEKNTIVLDPKADILQEATSVHSLALKLVNGSQNVDNILLLDSHGTFNQEILFQVLEKGEQHIVNMAKGFRSSIAENIENDLTY